jgi:hypothetical protein
MLRRTWRMLRHSWRPPQTSSPATKAARIPRPCARVQEIAGQLRLGGEQRLLPDPSQLAVLLIRSAPFGQGQSPADQGVATGCSEGQRDRHLAQRGPACGAAVLAGRASAIG